MENRIKRVMENRIKRVVDEFKGLRDDRDYLLRALTKIEKLSRADFPERKEAWRILAAIQKIATEAIDG